MPRIVIARAVTKAKDHDHVDSQEIAILETKVNVLQELRFVTTMTFKIMFTEVCGSYHPWARFGRSQPWVLHEQVELTVW